MRIRTVGTAERYDGVVPVATLQTLGRSPDIGGQDIGAVLEAAYALQAEGSILSAWLPASTEHSRVSLWDRVMVEQLKVWEAQLNPAIVGLGMIRNQWSVIYDRAAAESILRSGYDQLTPAALHARSKKHRELQGLTDPERVQDVYFRKNILEVNLGPSTPWFITFSKNHETTEISSKLIQNRG